MVQTDGTDVLAMLRVEWRQVGRSKAARTSLEALRARDHGEIPPWVVDLGGMVRALEPHGGLDRLHRARLVAVLLCGATDPLVRRCLLQTLLPGIVSVARKLRFGEGIADSPRTFLADLVAEAVELLEDWAGQSRPYAAPDLLGALRCRMRRRMLADKARRFELVETPEAPLDTATAGDDLERRLAVAAASGVTDVDLLYARCVLGHSTSELAVASGVSGRVLHRRLEFAAQSFLSASS